jgi:hypothetical protein
VGYGVIAVGTAAIVTGFLIGAGVVSPSQRMATY